MQQYKTCNNCLQTQQIIDFHKSSDSKDGHRARCKSCIKEFDASRYQKNLDANRERALSYYHAHKEHYAKKAAENYSTIRALFQRTVSQKGLITFGTIKSLSELVTNAIKKRSD
jgi:hypothetical protein